MDSLDSHSDALDLFRRGDITHFELSKALGLDRFETDAYLKKNGVFEGSLTHEEVDHDVKTLKRLLESKLANS